MASEFEDLFEEAPIAYFSVGVDGCIRAANRAAGQLLKVTSADLVGRPVLDLYAETATGRDRAQELFVQFKAGERIEGEKLEMRTATGSSVWVRLWVRPVTDVAGQVVASRSAVIDVSENHRSEQRYQQLLRATPDAIVVVNELGDITEANRAAEALFSRPRGQLIDASVEELMPSIERERHRHLRQGYARDPTARPMARGRADIVALRGDGATFPAEISLSPFRDDGQLHVIAAVRDVTKHNRLMQELTKHAFYDSLTGLANRALFQDRLGHAISRCARQGRCAAVLLLDLDNFKRVNDSWGHAVGDELLREVGRRLLRWLRPSDTVARFGGDEFAALLEGVDGAAEASRIVARLLPDLRRPIQVDQREFRLTASIGIALGASGTSGAELVRNADIAMYVAKGGGKDRASVFTPEMHSVVLGRLEMERDLRRAVAERTITVCYQPIVEVATGRIRGTEALARWTCPGRGSVPPLAFIPLAEEEGLIADIGRSIMREACLRTRRWQQEFPEHAELQVSVNVSPLQLRDPAFIGDVVGALIVSGLPADSLILEITEGVFMGGDESLDALDQLKALGVRISVDDFGQGYSSLGYLQRLPIDIVKVDKVFVEQLTPTRARTEHSSSIARAIVGLSQDLGLQTCAEGVENRRQLDAVRMLGCDLVQGHLFAPALEEEQLALLLEGPDLPWAHVSSEPTAG